MLYTKPPYPGYRHGERTTTWDNIYQNKIHWEWREDNGAPVFDLLIDDIVVATNILRDEAARAAGGLLASSKNDKAQIRPAQQTGNWFFISEEGVANGR